MGIVKIEKELKSNVNRVEAKKRQQEILPGASLNSLNNSNKEYHFDFGNNSAGMNNGKLKNEIGIMPACIKTAISSIIKIVVFIGIIFLVLKYAKLDIDLSWFSEKSYLTKDSFWDEFLRVGLIMGLSLLIICFITKLFINSSIKRVLKKNYLSRMNTYIYDGFIAVYNVIIYVILAFIYFININKTYKVLEKLRDSKLIVEGINIELFNLFKYGVVIVISVFIALNVLRGISIIYKNNKFVFEEQL